MSQIKTASLVFFYMGESSYLNRLAQETVPTHLALTGYDKTVLLRHETDLVISDDIRIELSEKAEQMADVVDIPTRDNFVKYLDELGKDGYVVDLFVFSHGGKNTFRVSKGTYGDNTAISGRYIEKHVDPLKLRMVWQCNCFGSTLNDTWRKLGARVTGGSRSVNFYPTRFKGFMKRWLKGEGYGTAVAKSDTRLVRTPVQIYIPADAAVRSKEWNGSLFKAARVLGKTEEAEAYFRECWIGDEWREGKSGRQTLNYSSRFLIEGNRKTTKSTVW